MRSVQLGGLCDCVAASAADDLACLAAAREWFDVVLIGNHEHPYFGGPRFAGFWRCREVGEELRKLDDERVLRPCAFVDGILVSHAGLGAGWGFADAAEAAGPLAGRASVFAQIGRARGGLADCGGVLWADWSEPEASFRQIVGHTPGGEPRRRGGAICLDVGAGDGARRIVGALVRDGDVELVDHAV